MFNFVAHFRGLIVAGDDDNYDSTSQMSRSRITMQETHKSAISLSALARGLRVAHKQTNTDITT